MMSADGGLYCRLGGEGLSAPCKVFAADRRERGLRWKPRTCYVCIYIGNTHSIKGKKQAGSLSPCLALYAVRGECQGEENSEQRFRNLKISPFTLLFSPTFDPSLPFSNETYRFRQASRSYLRPPSAAPPTSFVRVMAFSIAIANSIHWLVEERGKSSALHLPQVRLAPPTPACW